MVSLLYKLFVLAVLFIGGYLLMRYGMNLDQRTALIVAFVILPIITFVQWFIAYRGKRFK